LPTETVFGHPPNLETLLQASDQRLRMKEAWSNT
jgi:hypothetical protein